MTNEIDIAKELDTAQAKAWDSLSKYKFLMFGYWAAWWVKLNRLSGQKRPNPFKVLVHVARALARGDTVTINEAPIAPSRRAA